MTHPNSPLEATPVLPPLSPGAWLNAHLKGDRIIWIVVLLLSLFSLLAVYSSTGTLAYKYQSGNTEYYLFKHLGLMAFGLVLMFLSHLVDYRLYARISKLAIWVVVPLLMYTLAKGTNLNEASRWITLPVINITFQTSDMAKLVLIIYMARLLSRKQGDIKNFRESFVPIIVPVVGICMLIAPANLSTAAILFSTCLLIMFIGRVSLKHIGILLATGVLALSMFILVSKALHLGGRVQTWENRIERFSGGGDPDENFQADEAKIAIAGGGVLGRGPGNSIQRNFLPHPYSDFIYAVIIEEYGLWGGFFVVMLYLTLLFRSVKIIVRAPRAFGALLAAGLSFSLVIQAMVNMAVTVGLFPVTGQPLPMLSMGGTSLWFTSISIGVILSVSRGVENEDADQPQNTNANVLKQAA